MVFTIVTAIADAQTWQAYTPCCMTSNALQAGTLTLDEETPQHLGVPQWRSLVTYVPQSRVQPKGTPSELYFTAQVRRSPSLSDMG